MNAIILLIQKLLYPFSVLRVWLAKIPGLGGFNLKLTLAGKVAWAFGFCLTIALLISYLRYLFVESFIPNWSITQGDSYREKYLTLDYFLYILLGIVASTLLYWGIRFATLELPSLYPEIDRCWDALDRWRQNEKLEWDEFERFALLGGSLETVKSIQSSRAEKGIGPIPSAEKEWMHWFGDSSRVFLHCKKICNLSSVLDSCWDESSSSVSRPNSGTIIASMGIGGETQTPEQFDSHQGFETQEPAFDSDVGRQTLDPYDSGIDISEMDVDIKRNHDPDLDVESQLGTFDDDDDQPIDRINYLSGLALKRVEGNIPFNGVLVVIPFNKFLNSKNYKSITDALKTDLEALREGLDLVLPVMIMFSSMENDFGFPKLMGLLGEERARTGRFGAGGAKLSEIPLMTTNTAKQAVDRTVKSFESWVFNRWGKANQLSSAPQNIELYKMLIRIRGKFHPHFEHLLEEVFVKSTRKDEHANLLFGGCYFSATGKKRLEQGFVAGTLAKCDELSELSGWGRKSLEKNRLYGTAANLMFVGALAIVAIALLIGMSGGP